MDADLVIANRCLLGEAPTWHADEQCIYWSDIAAHRLHRFHPKSGTNSTVLHERLIAGITVESDGALLLLGRWGAIHRLHAGIVKPVRRIHWRHLGFRFNDAIADPAGRVFAGVMAYEAEFQRSRLVRSVRHRLQRHRIVTSGAAQGAVCRIDAGGEIRPIVTGLGRPNGMAFSPDLRTLYVTDSLTRRIYAYRYDPECGTLTHARLFLDLAAEPGVPDGLVVDTDGCLWSARHKSGQIVRYSAEGREMTRIRFPTRGITSLAFGGTDNRDLYVTAGGGDDPASNGEAAGALFRIRAPVTGGPVWHSRVANA